MMTENSKKNNSSDSLPADIPIKAADGQYLSALHPKYLHTNSTSHTWPFSAVAELIDNAYDPDVDASQLVIDVKESKGDKVLVLTDNGAGMMPDKLYKMVSFGFSEKVAVGDHHPVGQYGNGFKSGAMRLGKDALVFTKTETRWSLGFLSQTYLEKIHSNTIIVPFVTWDPKKFTLIGAESGGRKSLLQILDHSVVSSLTEIKDEFKHIDGTTGTRIIISNLRRRSDGKNYELDFVADSNDIRIPDDSADTDESRYKREQRQDHIPASDYSLRAYCAILYLKPRMQIILRGKKVKTLVIAKSLAKTEVDLYTPTGYSKPVKITFGFSQNKNHYGIMMYHRNRLIKPYVRVGYQLKPNSLGVGVIGVIECDFLQPTHNKQDFDQSKAFRACMAGLGRKLNEYWQEKKGANKSNSSNQQQVVEEAEVLLPDQKWVQCDNMKCLKWRVLPDDTDLEALPDKWYCKDHPLPEWRSCDLPEKLEDEKEIVTPYKKEVSKQLKKEQQMKRKQSESNLKRASELLQMVEKKEKELEEEKRKRTQNEAKAKAHEDEIKRLKMQLEVRSESPNNSINNKTPTKSNIVAATTPRSAQIKRTSSTPTPSKTAASPVLLIQKTSNKTTQPSLVPSPGSEAVALDPATPGSVTSIAVARATRQSINQAMKLRLPFTPRRTSQGVTTTQVVTITNEVPTTKAVATTQKILTAQAIGAVPGNAAQSVASPQRPNTLSTLGQKPIVPTATSVVLNTPILPKIQAIPGTTTILPKSAANGPHVISLASNNQISVASTPSTTPGAPRVYRFVVTDPKIGGSLNKMKPNVQTVAIRPNAPVNMVKTGHVITQVQTGPTQTGPAQTGSAQTGSAQTGSAQTGSAQTGPDRTTKAQTTQAQANLTVQTSASKDTTVNTHVKQEPTSNDINRQLAQIGIDAIAAQADDMVPSMAIKTPTSKQNILMTEKQSNKTNSIVSLTNGDNSASTSASENHKTGSKRKVNQIVKDDDDDEDEIEIIEKKRKMRLEVKDEEVDKPKIVAKFDQDILEEIEKIPKDNMKDSLLQRCQQLRDLRRSICQLLGLLVPEINLPRSETMPLDDNTIDVLLRDVLGCKQRIE